MRRLVSRDFIAAMEEKLEHGRSQGRTGWDSHWKKWLGKAVEYDFVLSGLLNKLEEEVGELLVEVANGTFDKKKIRLEAADVANVAMMIADVEGALNDISTPEPPPVEGDTVTIA